MKNKTKIILNDEIIAILDFLYTPISNEFIHNIHDHHLRNVTYEIIDSEDILEFLIITRILYVKEK